MPMWTCDVEACAKPAVRNADCILCDRHLCFSHLQTPTHQCPPWQDADAYNPIAREAEKTELENLFRKVDMTALEAVASTLRNGIQCSIPVIHHHDKVQRSSVMGGMNYHIDVRFVDGVVWLARIRRFNTTSPPPLLRDYILRSEYATMKTLERTKVPTPKVFHIAFEGTDDNPVGVSYMLIEKMPGKPLSWANASTQQKERLVEQLADMFIELRKYQFDRMGSLDDPESCRHVGPFARESMTDFDGSQMSPLGPFSSLREYHTASIQLILDLIVRNEMYAEVAIDAYLIHRFLLDLIPHVLPPPPPHDELDGKFFLKHADDKGDHILVDEEYNITSIIDWEWAYTAPEAIAFNSPIGFLPVAEFYQGVNTSGEEEELLANIFDKRGYQNLSKAVRNGRLQHRFAFCCGYDLSDWDGFLGLFRGLRDAVRIDQGLEWTEWKGVALQRYQGDCGLKVLQKWVVTGHWAPPSRKSLAVITSQLRTSLMRQDSPPLEALLKETPKILTTSSGLFNNRVDEILVLHVSSLSAGEKGVRAKISSSLDLAVCRVLSDLNLKPTHL